MRTKYTISVRDKQTGISLSKKSGKIRIGKDDDYTSIADKITKKHNFNPDAVSIELRLKNFTFKKK